MNFLFTAISLKTNLKQRQIFLQLNLFKRQGNVVEIPQVSLNVSMELTSSRVTKLFFTHTEHPNIRGKENVRRFPEEEEEKKYPKYFLLGKMLKGKESLHGWKTQRC